MIKQYIIIVSALVYLTSCNNGNTTSTQSSVNENMEEVIEVDTNNISIIKLDSTNNWLQIFENKENAELSQSELVTIEKLLQKSVEEYNIDQKKGFEQMNGEHPEWNLKLENYIIELPEYKRQYFAVFNEKKAKMIWINCFCSNDNPNWKKGNAPVLVHDGGKCYFNLKINLSTKTYYDFMVNGHA